MRLAVYVHIVTGRMQNFTLFHIFAINFCWSFNVIAKATRWISNCD